MSTSGAQLVRRVRRELEWSAFAPPERLTVSQWSDRFRVLHGSDEAEPGPWRTDRTPYLRDVMDAFSNPRVREIVIMKRERSGGTAALMNMILYALDAYQGPMLWTFANQDNANFFNTERFRPTFMKCQRLAQRFSGRKSDMRSSDFNFEGSKILFRGSAPNEGGKRNTESNSARVVVCEELDRCDINTPTMIKGRVTTFPNHKIIKNGTPEEWMMGIHLAYEQADVQLRYWVPCPWCGAFFVRDFSGVRWLPGPDGDPLHAKPSVVAEQAWYVCPHCDEMITRVHHARQLALAVWAPRPAPDVPVREQTLPSEEVRREALNARSVGFHIDEFMSSFVANPYGQIAAEYVENKGIKTKDWMNRRRGLAYKPDGEHLRTHELMRLCRPVADGGYRFGVVPRSGVVLLGGMDVQGDRVYVLVQAFTAYMRRSWLVWCGCEIFPKPGGIAANLDFVREIVERRFMREDEGGEGGGAMRVTGWAIDSGFQTKSVYSTCMALGGVRREIWPVKGRPGERLARNAIGAWTKGFAVDGKGRPLPDEQQPLLLMHVDTWMYADWLYDCLARSHAQRERASLDGAPAEELSAAPGLHQIDTDLGWPEATLEQGVHESKSSRAQMLSFFESLTSEERRKELDRAKGTFKRVWAIREGFSGVGNHFRDIWKYVHALAVLRCVPKLNGAHVLGLEEAAAGSAAEKAARAAGAVRPAARPAEIRSDRAAARGDLDDGAVGRRGMDPADYWRRRPV